MENKNVTGMTDEEYTGEARKVVENYADTCRKLQMDTAKDIEKMRRKLRMSIR